MPLTTLAALGAFVVYYTAQRLTELRTSARNARALRARGGHEVGRGHFPLFVALHSIYPVALVAETLAFGTQPGGLWPLWLGLVAGAQALRVSTQRALGERWTARIWVVPGLPPVHHGPYRWMRHPNYLAVSVELAAAALLFGAWRVALAASALNLVALAIRIPVEERALARAASARGDSAPEPSAQADATLAAPAARR